jgi:hypothetical protein
MGIRNSNTTNYVHNDEPNLYDLHKAMAYDQTGRPILRVADAQAGYTSKNRESRYRTTKPHSSTPFNTVKKPMSGMNTQPTVVPQRITAIPTMWT